MTERHALLIGVPWCDDERFTEIGAVVRNDVDSMHQALERSGYSVTTFGVDDGGPEPTGTRIRRAIRSACREAPVDGVLLVYFSGHGVSLDGQDFLVPSDADRDRNSLDPESLVPVIPSDLTDCRARLMVFFVDACRDDLALGRESGTTGGVVPYLAAGSFVLVTGCEAGQRCHYTETGSIFTQALAQVLDRRHPARTLSEVVSEVSQEIRRRAARSEDLQQSPGIRHRAMLQDAKDVVICDGDELTGAWRRAADTIELWKRCDQAESRLAATRDAVLAVIDNCARRCGDAYEALQSRTGINDPWFDQNYPIRVLERVALLLGEDTALSSAEAAMLVVAPFLREVILAEGVRLAAGVAPTNFTRTYQEGPRTDLEITHEMHQQIVRRAEGLDRRGLTGARDALAMWLVHQWLATRLSVWQSSAARDCYDRASRLLDGYTTGGTAREMPKLVETLVRAVGAPPVDHQVVERLGAAYVDDRWRALASLLWLGGILAADLRRMPPVIADHLGTRMELPLSTVKNAADRVRWARRDDALEMQMPCDHPAQHAAFQDLVARVAKARETIADLSMDDIAGLPARFTADGLRPERRPDDTPAYEIPLSRFRLSEDKIRELLMGRQLYDDPALAIRELYQNAMDACRYRNTRIKGLRQTSKDPGFWTGRISFRQGLEGNREYIECEDNGVGMDTETLKQVFANAGERFVYQDEFRTEQAEWQELNPPLQLIPNSQFGVGVFSYFMLADEITLVTRPVGRNGIAAPKAHRVDIASSGGLFQITSSEELPAGGTRARLYLTDNDERVSVLTTLRKLLWISDFRVDATAYNSVTEIWEPRELRYQDETTVSLKYKEDLWWVSGDGGLAADGIRTNEGIFGLIVNLRDARRPQFTVDRKKLRKWDKNWVREEIAKSLPGLMEWQGLTLSWLWKVAESAPDVAQQIFDYLVDNDVSLPVGGAWGQGTDVSMTTMGCLPDDWELFDPEKWNHQYARWFTAWRAGRWAWLAGSRANARTFPLVANGDGYPTVDPTDAELLNELSHIYGDQALSVDEILLAAIHQDQPMASRLRRIRRYAITGLDISPIRECPPLTITCKEENQPLVRALAAWSPPGTPRRKIVAGWLVKTSAELDQPLAQVFTRAKQLMPDDWTAPDVDLSTLTDYICSTADTKLVSVDLDGIPPWTNDLLTPTHLVAASGVLGREVSQILTLCDNLAPLGVEVAGREYYPTDLDAIEVEALRYVYTLGQRLEPLQLVMIAAKVGATVADTHHRLRRLQDRSLISLPNIPSTDFTPGLEDLEFIENVMFQYRVDIRRRQFTTEKPCLKIVLVINGRQNSQRRIARAITLAPFASPMEPVTYPELVDLAGDLNCSVTQARTAFLEIFPEAEVPAAILECDSLHPHFEMSSILLDSFWRRSRPASWRIDPGDLVAGAVAFGRSLGEFLSMVLPYRALGAPIPTVSRTIHSELDQVFPDEYDEDMLTVFDEYGYGTYLSDIDALTLVRIAGRLGWFPSEAHRRLYRLGPIGVQRSYPDVVLPDEIVRWQDLLLLTEHLDGRAPAVSGQVTAEHLAKAARETGESVDWIVGRLRLYAPLFALSVD